MTDFITLSDTVLDRRKVTAVYLEASDTAARRVRVLFDNGTVHVFENDDARLLWREFAERPGWREDDDV